MPSRTTTVAALGGFAVALSALLGMGGAALRPGGVWLGVPPLATAAVVIALASGLTLSARRDGLAAAAGLLAPIALVLVGLPMAGARALTGPPLVALALAGLALAVAARGVRLPRILFLPFAFAVLVGAAGRSHVRVGPQGDEPHYLMVAESLRRDGDLALERDYSERRYALFHDTPLAPHFRVRGLGGVVYSLHAVGLSVLVLPAWALAGYAGVTVFMALLAAFLALEIRSWVRELTGRAGLAEAAGWVAVLSPPLLPYAGLVFTEVPAALAVSLGLRLGRRPGLGPAGALAVGVAAAALPWLNVRFAPLAVLVLAHGLWRHPRRKTAVALLAPALVSVAGLLAYHQALYGFLDPRRVYGRRPEFALQTLAEGLPGLLLDQEFGLLVYAPVLALALPGSLFLWRKDRRLALTAGVAVAVVFLTAGTWHMWRGGWNPPGRFLVPITPVLAVAVAMAWDRRGLTAGSSLLLGWTLWIGLAGAWQPELVHRDRDGTAPLFRRVSGAREWTGLLPAYVLSDPDRHRLAAVWAVALLIALPWRKRAATPSRVALAGLGFVLAAQAAASVSRARTEDRDASRLVGRPAIAVPGFRLETSATGTWTPEALGWGPLFEPHRFAEGAEVGRRLPLVPGRYRLRIVGEALGPGLPALRVAPDRPAAPWRSCPARPVPGGFEADFDVRAGERAVDLRLRGGGPILLKGFDLLARPLAGLSAQPSAGGAGPSQRGRSMGVRRALGGRGRTGGREAIRPQADVAIARFELEEPVNAPAVDRKAIDTKGKAVAGLPAAPLEARTEARIER